MHRSRNSSLLRARPFDPLHHETHSPALHMHASSSACASVKHCSPCLRWTPSIGNINSRTLRSTAQQCSNHGKSHPALIPKSARPPSILPSDLHTRRARSCQSSYRMRHVAAAPASACLRQFFHPLDQRSSEEGPWPAPPSIGEGLRSRCSIAPSSCLERPASQAWYHAYGQPKRKTHVKVIAH